MGLIVYTTKKPQINTLINTKNYVLSLPTTGYAYQAIYLPTIGILRPMPNAFGETLKIGGV